MYTDATCCAVILKLYFYLPGEAKSKAPCVIFIDELDSVGGKRVQSPNHPYARQTINKLLAEMDGFEKNEGVIVLGATNFPKALDR